ncbi:MAG TPA: sigma-70 family RNA polymerase sigma factor [Thermoanaerobaculia bacterium]
MNPRELFLSNLATIERVIAIVCRRGGLFAADAEDFASEVKLALIEDDYAILRKYEGRSSLDTFLTVVVQRLLADSRMRAKGRWHASTEAQRLGPVAVQLETLVRRDGRSLDEASLHIRTAHPDVTGEQLAALLERLPARTARPRPVDVDAVGPIAGGEPADARALAGDRQRVADAVGRALRDQLREIPDEDRMLIRLRFAGDMSIADISRMTRLPQRPLYRRLEALLVRLRAALTGAGVDRATIEGLVGRDDLEAMDFGLTTGKSGTARQSIQQSAEHAGEEP